MIFTVGEELDAVTISYCFSKFRLIQPLTTRGLLLFLAFLFNVKISL